MKSNVTVEGVFRIWEIDVTSKTRLALETRNLITNTGLSALVALLARGVGTPTVGGIGYDSDSVINAGVARMVIGSTVSPAATTVTDTEMSTGFFSDVLPEVAPVCTFPGTGIVKFSRLILPGFFAGTTITEEGLLSSDGSLIARSTFSYTIQGAIGIQCEHTITIARV